MASLADLLTQIPPHDIPAERAVLGSAMLGNAPQICPRLTAEQFYIQAHRRIYAVIAALHDEGRGVDLVTLSAACRAAELEVEDLQLLPALLDEAGTAILLDDYLRIVIERAAQRDMIRLATEAIGQAYDGVPATEIAAKTAASLSALVERTDPEPQQASEARTPTLQPLGTVLEETFTEAQFAMPDLVPTPIHVLNDAFAGGLARQELCILGGLPGSAKSALLLELARYAADPGHGGHASWICSLEMGTLALGRRLLSQNAQVAASAFRNHRIEEYELAAIRRILPTLGALPIWITDAVTHLSQLQRLLTAAAHTDTLPRVVFVDYLQLLQGPRRLDRRLEVSYVASGLKRLAQRHDLTVVALSSITPPPPEPGRKPRRPTMRNLRESRDIDHAADIILMLWQPDPAASPRELWIEKGRDGAAGGHAALDFSPPYVRFQEMP